MSPALQAGKGPFSLKNRLILIYGLLISLSILCLSILINRFAGTIFERFIRDNIKAQSGEIVRSVADQYDPAVESFDLITLQAMGMYFVHQGYIISITDQEEGIVWDARACDMRECSMVIEEISQRMGEYRLDGGFQNDRYPLYAGDRPVGQISIETYGPFFYSEAESGFLQTLNRFLFTAGVVFTLISVIISIILAAAISRPILAAARAARHIAGGNLSTRIPDNYRTRELRELSLAVNELAEELEKGERRQKRLTGDIAHELRTPLTCLQGNIEAMIDGIWKPTAERLGSCHEEIVRLTKLVEDLNSLSVLEQENLVLKKTDFDLAKLLAAAAEQFGPAAREKGIEIRTELLPAPVRADYDRLMQVFINLLSNGVKYTDRGRITLRLSAPEKTAEAAGYRYKITLSDTGIGIPEEDLPHIFERFYRSDKSRNRGSGGAGIGLSIAAAIVSAHGGRISAENRNIPRDAEKSPGGTPEPSRGSLFQVLL
jgi:signal transduction histidine kinase